MVKQQGRALSDEFWLPDCGLLRVMARMEEAMFICEADGCIALSAELEPCSLVSGVSSAPPGTAMPVASALAASRMR